MNEKEFVESLKRLDIVLTDKQLKDLEEYYNLLISYNKKINLTRIVEKKDVYLKHFYDSITLIKAINLRENIKVCDIGTGAGLPGVVLKIVFPNLDITLVDSLNKRVEFLKEVIKKLNLENIRAIHGRGEDYIRKNRNIFDLITCRAVAKLSVISEISLPGVKINGYFIPMKANIDEEIKDTKYLNVLGSILESIITFTLPIEDSIRNLIVIKRIGDIDIKYPRNYDKIIKNEIKK